MAGKKKFRVQNLKRCWRCGRTVIGRESSIAGSRDYECGKCKKKAKGR